MGSVDWVALSLAAFAQQWWDFLYWQSWWQGGAPWGAALVAGAIAGGFVLSIARWGLLAGITFDAVWIAVSKTPLTWDVSLWYAWRTGVSSSAPSRTGASAMSLAASRPSQPARWTTSTTLSVSQGCLPCKLVTLSNRPGPGRDLGHHPERRRTWPLSLSKVERHCLLRGQDDSLQFR